MNFIKTFCAAGLLALSATGQAHAAQTFHGEVSDSQCALNVHSLTRSHQEMLKSKSMGGTSNTCSVYCIEHLGGYLVLSTDKDVFRLDRADLVHGFEGRRVVITGVLDPKLKQIHVLKIDLENKP
jgi:putative hemolysin